MAMTCELDKFMELLSGKIDSASCQLIKETLQVQISLISEKHLELMFQGADLTMGVKSLLNYHIQVFHDEFPLQTGKIKGAQKSSPGVTAPVDDKPGTNSKQVGVSTADLKEKVTPKSVFFLSSPIKSLY